MNVENFTAYNPVKLRFGKNITEKLGETVKLYGSKVFLIYGKVSVKKYGYYKKVVDSLTQSGLELIEYRGIKPNPIVDDVRKAVALGSKHNIDVVVALGGGSVIDSAKIIGLSIANKAEPWQIMTGQSVPQKSLPLITVLTLSATGSEMNAAAVLQNHTTGQKLGFVNPLLFPKESFLDPQFTTTVPASYTAYGVVDLIAHALEAFFGKGEPSVIDRITSGIIVDAMEHGPVLMNDLENYNLRAALMLDATLALNGVTTYGKKSGDWGVHAIGHELSLLFDTPHGAALSIVYPAWLKLQKNRIPKRISCLGKLLFGYDDIDKTISALKNFFQKIGSPITLQEADINTTKNEQIIKQMSKNNVSGMHQQLHQADYAKLVEFMRQE